MDQRLAFARSRDGTHIAYAQSGKGPPLVKAGTWLTHLQHDWDSPVWSHWLNFLSERHTLVRYDPRGCGLSRADPERVSLEAWVDDLEAVVDRLGLERFPLLGMSQGAAVAVEYALRHPQRISHLVLYAPLITGWRRGSNALAQRWKNMEQLVRSGWGGDNLAFPSMFAHLFLPDARAEHIRWYAELQRKSCDGEMAARIIEVLGDLRLFSRLKDVRTPAVVIQIARDQVLQPESAPGVAGEIPGCHFVSIDSGNHILLGDEPGWDAFRRALRQYLPGQAMSGAGRPDPALLEDLSKRQLEILLHVARGLNNRAVADALFISEKTVRNHITQIFDKLGVHSRAEAIVLARDLGVL